MKVNLDLQELEILRAAIAKETMARYNERQMAYKQLDKELCDEYDKDLQAAEKLWNKIFDLLKGKD